MAAATQFGEKSGIWEISEIAQTPEGKALLRRSLTEVTEGAAFKSSHRSAQFLEYVVQHSAMGQTDQLKERLIGIELFGRLPSYDTGEDAIVRVTASDVRKRLVQHYSQAGSASEFRISLPSGKYVPELIRNPAFDMIVPAGREITEAEIPRLAAVTTTAAAPLVTTGEPLPPRRNWSYWMLPVLGLLMMIGSIALVFGNRFLHAGSPQRASSGSPPWAPLFDGSRPVLVVASDPDIKEIQRIAHAPIGLSDYANQHYIPANTSDLSSMGSTFMREVLRGDKISSYDGGIIAGLESLTPRGYRLAVKGARSTRMQDLQTDGNLVFLGSPRSNPWTTMYADYLDFRFAFDDKVESEVIRNVHPKNGEATEYAPTAIGFGTGVSFATISLLPSPGHTGRVLIIAGANAEGTEAAGILVTDPARWDTVQQACHFSAAPAKQSMQLLLQLGTMAGSADNVKVIACHALTPVS